MGGISCKFKRSIIGLAVLLLGVGLVGGILGYFTDGDRADNELTVGKNTIEIDEKYDPPEDITPGTSFVKDIKVKNVDGTDCYVRVKAVFSNSHMEQYCEIDWNEDDWVYSSEDGYWYYTEIIPEGSSTTSLFTTVTIKDDAPEGAMVDFDIIVYAESVESHQAQGFTSYTGAWNNYQKNKSN